VTKSVQHKQGEKGGLQKCRAARKTRITKKTKAKRKGKKKERNLLRWRENFFSFGTHFQSTTFYDERMRRERERDI